MKRAAARTKDLEHLDWLLALRDEIEQGGG